MTPGKTAAVIVTAVITVAACAVFMQPGCGGRGEKKDTAIPIPGIHTVQTTPADPLPGNDSVPARPPSNETDVVIRVAADSAREQNPELPGLEVVETKMAGDWAKVVLQPVDGSADAATWLLKKQEGTWRVVDFGTALIPENYPGAPPELFSGN